MNTLKFLPILALVLLAFTSCSGDDEGPNLAPTESERISNLFAPQVGGQGQGPISGDFTKFDFSTGSVTTSETDWDIAFRATTIIVNGGESTGSTDEPERTAAAAAYVALSDFAGVVNVETELLIQDAQSGLAITPVSDMGWYNYSGQPAPGNPPSNLITPLPGRILVFRTRDGRYAKMEIISYYLDNPQPPIGGIGMDVSTPRYYTFDYVYQPNEGITSFE